MIMEKMKIDEEIELIPLRILSAEIIFNSINRSRAHLRPWLPFVDQTISVADTRNFIKTVLDSSCSKKDFIFEIWHSDEFSGLIALKELDRINAKVEIGYWLDVQKTGQGIMFRATKALVHYAFQKLNLNRITIKVAAANTRSKAIPEKLGFIYEGIERGGEYIKGKFIDLHVYGLLKLDL